MIYGAGGRRSRWSLWSADWKIAAGHRIGVKVADNNTDFWLLAAPTMQTVTVTGGDGDAPVPALPRTQTIQGDPGTQLDSYLSSTVTVPPETIESSESDSFALPPRQKGDTRIAPSPPVRHSLRYEGSRSSQRRRASASASQA